MVFKRRNPRTILEATRAFIYPKGGFIRAIRYVTHRMRRLPDAPHRIARGVFAGTLVSFTPFFGFHFVSAALVAWAIRGNVLAAILATFVGNPVTFPLIAVSSIELGHRLLGIHAPMDFGSILAAFGNAWGEVWRNITAFYTDERVQWGSLKVFFKTIYLPYLVGGLGPGLVVSTALYYATLPALHAYQKLRALKARERSEKRNALRKMLAAAATKRAAKKALIGDDEGENKG